MKKYLEVYEIMIKHLVGSTEARLFQKEYIKTFKGDNTVFPQEEFEILNYLFSSCDMYCGDPDLFEKGDLTDEELRRDAIIALTKLKQIAGRH